MTEERVTYSSRMIEQSSAEEFEVERVEGLEKVGFTFARRYFFF